MDDITTVNSNEDNVIISLLSWHLHTIGYTKYALKKN